MYGLIAESVDLPEGQAAGSASRCAPRPASPTAARSPPRTSSSPSTCMQNKGQLRYRAYFGDIEKVEALGPHEVKFTFKPKAPPCATCCRSSPAPRSSPRPTSRTATSPGARWTRRSAPAPTRSPAPTPAARSIYRRDPDYWAKDLPVNVGAQQLRRDPHRLLRRPGQRLRGLQGRRVHLPRRDQRRPLADRLRLPGQAARRRRHRRDPRPHRALRRRPLLQPAPRRPSRTPASAQAIETMFNFEWINATLFHGVEQRAVSYWERSDMRAEGPPSAEEHRRPRAAPRRAARRHRRHPQRPRRRALRRRERRRARPRPPARRHRAPHRGRLHPGGRPARRRRRQAAQLEMMYASPDAEQYLSPFAQALQGIGIDASLRFVDSAQWRERAETFDFDAVHVVRADERHPGQRARRRLRLASTPKIGGSLNVSGVANPAIDKLITRDRDRRDPRGARRPRPRPRPGAARHAHPRAATGCGRRAGSPTTTTTATPTSCRSTAPASPAIWWADTDRYDALKAAGAIR